MNNDINFDDNEDEDNDNYQEQRTLEAHEIYDQEH
jgi:hypothetical protein